MEILARYDDIAGDDGAAVVRKYGARSVQLRRTKWAKPAAAPGLAAPPTFPARHGDKDLSSCRDQKRTCNSDKNASRIARLYSAPLRPSGRRYHDADGLSISLPALLAGAEIPEVHSKISCPFRKHWLDKR